MVSQSRCESQVRSVSETLTFDKIGSDPRHYIHVPQRFEVLK